jgi:integrase
MSRLLPGFRHEPESDVEKLEALGIVEMIAPARRVLHLMRTDVETKLGWAQWRARRLYALTATVAYTGIRAGEALCLQLADVDLDARIIQIVPRAEYRTKTAGFAQPVPMAPMLVPILHDWFDHRMGNPPLFWRAETPWLWPNMRTATPCRNGPRGHKPYHRLAAVAKRASVEEMTFQSLQRSWATHAEAAGMGPAMIAQIIRHTSTRTGEVWYRRADLPNMRAAVEAFDF